MHSGLIVIAAPSGSASAVVLPFVLVGVLVALIAVGFGSVGWRRRRGQIARTKQAAERYAAAGATYTSVRRGSGSSDTRWIDTVQGVRNGYGFTGRSEVRSAGPTHYSASDTLEDNDYIVHRVRVPLAGPVSTLRIVNRVHVEDDAYQAITADGNAGAVATGFPDFDDQFLVFCDDLPFLREVMTRELTVWVSQHPGSLTYAQGKKAEGGIAFDNQELAVEMTSGRLEPDRVFAAVDYLLEVVARLPTHLVPARQPAAREGQEGPR